MKKVKWYELEVAKPGDPAGYQASCGILTVTLVEVEPHAWEVVVSDHIKDYARKLIKSSMLDDVQHQALSILRSVLLDAVEAVGLGPVDEPEELSFVHICVVPGDPGHREPSLRGLTSSGKVYMQWASDGPWLPCNMKNKK